MLRRLINPESLGGGDDDYMEMSGLVGPNGAARLEERQLPKVPTTTPQPPKRSGNAYPPPVKAPPLTAGGEGEGAQQEAKEASEVAAVPAPHSVMPPPPPGPSHSPHPNLSMLAEIAACQSPLASPQPTPAIVGRDFISASDVYI